MSSGDRVSLFSMTMPVIMCAVCEKRVNEIVTMMCNANEELVYRVKCHGEVDEYRIPRSVILENKIDLSRGRAFTTKKLADAAGIEPVKV